VARRWNLVRISISCLRCRLWFDNLQDLVVHRAGHDEAPFAGLTPQTGPAGLARARRPMSAQPHLPRISARSGAAEGQ